ncbi:Peptide methionine sulfoxide reductase MsrA [Tepidimonas alkaliphilus]|uniref:Peptide methionine sulfoxide reductase MsrA n=1 Tax=Tepidimonas alkaliphilus TaxID=2588942 RepID=A0A554W503_9BURK|nr:peptide-methionine (S)-S-oxide reductase MsrA [Tepidimonas alkaliphilus]TSE18655.1 Peptide methionine sulfoxide reductase MsrA [Tepidimonas alkaliphilus]
MDTDEIVLAGGCFWCTQAVFDRVRGVRRTECGYANGCVERPTYERVCTGATGCAEAVRLAWDPAAIDLETLLRIFFATHDPTTPDRQGADVGTQYRSGIYWTRPAQAAVALRVMAELAAQRVFDAPIVTELQPLRRFTPAEPEHQGYFDRHPWAGYCQAVIAPKLAKLRAGFAERLRAGA